MLWWIAGGVVVAALVVLVWALLATLGSLRGLAAAMHALQRRAAGAGDLLLPALETTREHLERLEGPAEQAGRRAASLAARRRGGSVD